MSEILVYYFIRIFKYNIFLTDIYIRKILFIAFKGRVSQIIIWK